MFDLQKIIEERCIVRAFKICLTNTFYIYSFSLSLSRLFSLFFSFLNFALKTHTKQSYEVLSFIIRATLSIGTISFQETFLYFTGFFLQESQFLCNYRLFYHKNKHIFSGCFFSTWLIIYLN